MFLYARLVLDYLSTNVFHNCDEIKASVNQLPEKINDLQVIHYGYIKRASANCPQLPQNLDSSAYSFGFSICKQDQACAWLDRICKTSVEETRIFICRHFQRWGSKCCPSLSSIYSGHLCAAHRRKARYDFDFYSRLCERVSYILDAVYHYLGIK